MQYINNRWIVGSGAGWNNIDPTNGKTAWQGFAACPDQIDAAIIAARQAFFDWSASSLDSRIARLEAYAQQLKQRHEHFALLISQETGKPLWEAKTEVSAMIAKVAVSIDAYQSRTGLHKTDLVGGGALVTQHRPHGVFAILGPFNFPGHLPNGHIIPALLAGNTLVFKPSEYTPQIAIAMMEAFAVAGLPAGVINMVLGKAETGRYLSSHADIDGVLFTGSYSTGKQLHQQYAGHPEKILVLEMGGNNPLIVWDVNDLQAAAYYTIQSAYLTAGQRCSCARRLIIPDNQQGAKFLDVLKNTIQKIRVGDWRKSPEPFMGPLITTLAADTLLAAQQNLTQAGAEILIGMEKLLENTGFISPGLIDVTRVTQRTDVEWFGPLLQVIRVTDFAAALQEANATRYGLSAGLLCDDASKFELFSTAIRAGIISWNKATTGASSAAPFGGIGHSGNYRPSAYYAADYCAYPLVSSQSDTLVMPSQLTPGFILQD